MEEQILSVLAGEFHGLPKFTIMMRCGVGEDFDKQAEFDAAFGRLVDQGKLARTSRGYKASASPFGGGGAWR